jgi:hypothetical protein
MASKKSTPPQDAYILVVEDNLQNMILMRRLLDFMMDFWANPLTRKGFHNN